LKNYVCATVKSFTLTEQNGYEVGVLDDLLQYLGIDLLDAIGQVHGLQGGEEIEHSFLVHEIPIIYDGLLFPAVFEIWIRFD